MRGAQQKSQGKRAAALVTATGVVLGGAFAAAPSAFAVPGVQQITKTFSYTGAEQQFTVPTGITTLDVVAVGARGGNGADNAHGDPYATLGGSGDQVSATLPVTPGETLYLEVGGDGTMAGVGGFNGGGNGGPGNTSGAGGGGASDIRTCAAGASTCAGGLGTLASRLLVAAGGGGGGAGNGATGTEAALAGPGGDANAAGGDATYGTRGTASGGGAGTASAGGAGGATSGSDATDPGGDGSLGQGGSGAAGKSGMNIWAYAGSGGGGGGLYGGGGGGDNLFYGAGGGGGSDLVPAGGSSALDTTDPAQITISYLVGPVTSLDVSASPNSIAADGMATSTLTATATSIQGLGMSGLPVEFTSSDPDQQFGPVTDNGDGTYTTTVTSSETLGTATITASDSTDGVSGTTSLEQTAPQAPQITAQLSSSHPAGRTGWFRAPVTVQFTCTAGTEPLAAPCPSPVTISRQGTHTVRRQVVGADQRTGAVSVPVKLDRGAPKVTVRGARSGATYRAVRHLRCVAADALSGVASCRIATHRHRTRRGVVVAYLATARDHAGNIGKARGSYRIR